MLLENLAEQAPPRPLEAVRTSSLLLATQVFGSHGGVQGYMRRLLEVSQSFVRGAAKRYGCVVLARQETPPARLSDCDLRCAPSKPGYASQAFRAAANLRPGVVVAGHLGVAPVAMLLKRAGLARKYVVVLHGNEAWRRSAFSDRIAAQYADEVVATTRFTAERFAEANDIDPGRVKVIPLCLGFNSVPARLEPAPSSEKVTVLTVSRLAASDSYKGIDTLIEAIARLGAGRPSIRLQVVGNGDDRERLERLAAARGVAANVEFRGAVPDPELEALYSSCDIFALPSREEGFGIVFLEAMRHAKPCIGGRHGGTPEVIDHGVDGMLVEHGDAHGLASALLDLARRPDLRAQLGHNAQRKVASRFLYPHFESNWHALLDSLTAKN